MNDADIIRALMEEERREWERAFWDDIDENGWYDQRDEEDEENDF